MLISALVQCHYDYACSFWYSSLKEEYKKKLQVSQNKTVRFVLGENSRYHLNCSDFKSAGFLPIMYRVESLKLCHMYKISRKFAPPYLNDQFVEISHGYNTRNSKNNYVTDRCGTIGQTTFKYSVSVLWRELSNEIKSVTTYVNFKKAVKQFMWNKFHSKEQM